MVVMSFLQVDEPLVDFRTFDLHAEDIWLSLDTHLRLSNLKYTYVKNLFEKVLN